MSCSDGSIFVSIQKKSAKLWDTIVLGFFGKPKLDPLIVERYKNLPLPPDKILAEYVWIDVGKDDKMGFRGQLRSLTRTIDIRRASSTDSLPKCRIYIDHDDDDSDIDDDDSINFDNEIVLEPRRIFKDPFHPRNDGVDNILVLCDMYAMNGDPWRGNARAAALTTFSHHSSSEPWFSLTQPFTLFNSDARTPLGYTPKSDGDLPLMNRHKEGTNIIGPEQNFARHVITSLHRACLYAGITIAGTRQEGLGGGGNVGLPEYRVGPCVGVDAADQLVMSRYILKRICEDFGIYFTLGGDDNERRLNTKVSTKDMRGEGGIEVIKLAIYKLGAKHEDHVKSYGEVEQEVVPPPPPEREEPDPSSAAGRASAALAKVKPISAAELARKKQEKLAEIAAEKEAAAAAKVAEEKEAAVAENPEAKEVEAAAAKSTEMATMVAEAAQAKTTTTEAKPAVKEPAKTTTTAAESTTESTPISSTPASSTSSQTSPPTGTITDITTTENTTETLNPLPSPNTFRYGVAARGASVSIGRDTDNAGCGYFEDRRPLSDADPYIVTGMIMSTIMEDIDAPPIEPMTTEEKKNLHKIQRQAALARSASMEDQSSQNLNNALLTMAGTTASTNKKMAGLLLAAQKAEEIYNNPKVKEIIAKAKTNPKLKAAVTECITNPSAFAKYQNDPEIGSYISELKTAILTMNPKVNEIVDLAQNNPKLKDAVMDCLKNPSAFEKYQNDPEIGATIRELCVAVGGKSVYDNVTTVAVSASGYAQKAKEIYQNPKVKEIMTKTRTNPKLKSAVTECIANPAAFAKYQNDPDVGAAISELKTIVLSMNPKVNEVLTIAKDNPKLKNAVQECIANPAAFAKYKDDREIGGAITQLYTAIGGGDKGVIMGGGDGAAAGQKNTLGSMMDGVLGYAQRAQEIYQNPKVKDIISKAKTNPRMKAAVTECITNPSAFTKYQNDPEIGGLITELKTVILEMNPRVQEILKKAQNNPKLKSAVEECMANPTAFAKYKDDEEIGGLMNELKSAIGGGGVVDSQGKAEAKKSILINIMYIFH